MVRLETRIAMGNLLSSTFSASPLGWEVLWSRWRPCPRVGWLLVPRKVTIGVMGIHLIFCFVTVVSAPWVRWGLWGGECSWDRDLSALQSSRVAEGGGGGIWGYSGYSRARCILHVPGSGTQAAAQAGHAWDPQPSEIWTGWELCMKSAWNPPKNCCS